jgi:hypothetical protein
MVSGTALEAPFAAAANEDIGLVCLDAGLQLVLMLRPNEKTQPALTGDQAVTMQNQLARPALFARLVSN